MKYPKLVIASDGRYTAALLDGVFIGQGIERLVFSTEEKNGEMKSTICLMDLDVGSAKLETGMPGEEKFTEFLRAIAQKNDRP